ncbi:MFS transporter [Streptomyces sp. NPDC020983]|uniref:MFS transporter n=1 Tax=Streptomyces sp. NPDC020983 TaxID=3365106 RepID=UPI0037A3E135
MISRRPGPALWALALGYFSFGTSSLAVVGLGHPIGADLHVSQSQVGLLVTVFALTFALTAPLAPVLLGRLGRKTVLLSGLAVMAAGGVAAALAPTYGALSAARVLTALGGAAFGPAASVAGSLLVPAERRARALATVFAGMTAAAVLGVPLSTSLGQSIGWRWTTVGIAGLTLLALGLVAAFVPALERGAPATLAAFRPVLRTAGVVPAVTTTFAFMAAQFTVYGVMGAYLADRFGSGTGQVAALLLVFGVAGVVGNGLAGRVFERLGGPATITVSMAGFGVAFAALLLAPADPAAAVAAIVVWAVFSQLFQAPQQARLVALVPDQRALGLALNASSLYLGMSLGSLLGSSLLPALGASWLPAAGLAPLALGAAAHRASGRHHALRETAATAAPAPAAPAAPAHSH